MKREIKFRAWDSADIPFYTISGNNRMSCYGPEFRMDDNYNTLSFHTPDGMAGPAGDRESMKRFVLMQFTGLLDKNGKSIYEGDILKHAKNEHYQVLWDSDGHWMVDGNENTQGKDFLWRWAKVCEIIGNIYENPELLNKN